MKVKLNQIEGGQLEDLVILLDVIHAQEEQIVVYLLDLVVSLQVGAAQGSQAATFDEV